MFRLISSIGVVMATYAAFALLGPVLGPAILYYKVRDRLGG